ncbi:MAG: hypothetical protein JNL90_03175 [Planctomycetes bacterium]|nr:hypothetical protein [Planctomycetota bacterium]
MNRRLALFALWFAAALPLAAGQVPQPPQPKPNPGPKPERKPELPERPQPELPKGRPELPQPPTLGALFSITSVAPARVALRAGSESSLSIVGSALDSIEQFRIVRAGKPQPGFVIESAVATGGTVASLRVRTPADAAAGPVELEFRRKATLAGAGGAFAPVKGAALEVVRRAAPPRRVGSRAEIGRGAKLTGGAGDRPAAAAVPVAALGGDERRVPRNVDFERLHGFDVTEFRPRERAALGATFEFRGSGLAKVEAVKLGDRVLELITRDDTRIVGRFPGGVETIAGTLAFVIGRHTIPIATRYEVVDGFALLQPKVTLRHAPSPMQGPAMRADGRAYDRTDYIIGFRVEQIPGNECTLRLASYRDGGDGGSSSSVVANARVPEFGELNVNLNGALLAARPQLTVTARDRANDLEKSYTLELPIELAPRETVVVEETAKLRDSWEFEQTWSWGQTDGTSDFGAGKVEVGEVEVGGDLAFRIASGPFGTEAVWRSQLSKLKNGWTVESMEWSETCVAPEGQPKKARALTVARSLADAAVFDVGESLPGNFMRDAGIPDAFAALLDHTFRSIPVVLRPHGKEGEEFVWTRPMVFLDYDEVTEGNRPIYGLESSHWLRSMAIALKAETTLLNDHRVTVRLERITFRKPPGEPLEPFVRQAISHDREQIELVPTLRVR